MAQTSMTVRIDNQQKAIFDELCAQFGMSANTAINIFVRTVNRCRKIPFTISAESNNDIRENALNVFSELRKYAIIDTNIIVSSFITKNPSSSTRRVINSMLSDK